MEFYIEQSPEALFTSDHYLKHNEKRLGHLASLGLDLINKSVLEVGAGIGDHTSFFLQQNCEVISIEARLDNLSILQKRYPHVRSYNLNLDQIDLYFNRLFEIVYCYGLLYHLSKPAEAIEFMARHCQGLLLLETCVSFGADESVNLCQERSEDPTQSFSGIGCRPTRKWVFNQLRDRFEFVYLPVSQPDHEEFPIDWLQIKPQSIFNRAIFIASRFPINNPMLLESLPDKQFAFKP